MSDSPKVTDQKALTTSEGGSWLVVAALVALLECILLFLMRDLRPLGAATIGIVCVVVLYLAMIVVRYRVPRKRVRLGSLAFLTIAIVLCFVAVTGTIIFNT
ncbi:MAG: hypothetical protein JWM50_2370 [Microbacteriaceae bacterium]|jgi:hypothetical protein|nr:hypothetical protein [Microbacteriaceae bacterium]